MNHLSQFTLTSAFAALTIGAAFAETTLQQTTSTQSVSTTSSASSPLKLNKGSHITFIGGGLASRMVKFSEVETELQVRYPDLNLVIRNIADEGDTPGFRPHPGRKYDDQFAFPGAKELVRKDLQANSKPGGFFETPDQWLKKLKTDVVIACFGYASSFDGPDELDRYKKELDAFLKHTKGQKYNGKSAPQIALVSPIAFEDLSSKFDLPDGRTENANLSLYADAMKEVAAANDVLFIDAFTATKGWYAKSDKDLTQDGFQLNRLGYQTFGKFLADSTFGKTAAKAESKRDAIFKAVEEKNWVWHNYYKVPNGVHVYGRRFKPYGPANYPDEMIKAAEMTDLRDQATWAAANGKSFDLAAADAKTHKLPEVKTNAAKRGNTYKSPEDTIKEIKMADGYKIELFASEREFPRLANPCQISFDNKGRLWVASMPSYPHWRVGDPKPTDTLAIYEDTNGDGKADKETIFADDLHLAVGFEFAPEGVYVSQADSVVLLKDTNGDDKYDVKEYVLSGFDDHDSHHAISAFCADPSGAIYMGEGIFLHSNIETPYGTKRGTNGGFWRYNPNKKHLERAGQYNIPNPYGIVFDDFGQNFFLYTSNPKVGWMNQASIKPKYGRSLQAPDLLTSNKVRPTSGFEIVSSGHFPDDVQGDILICNNIGFLGIKQHKLKENGTGFTTEHHQDLFVTKDKTFRPVDLEFAPDGSLYVADWSNILIGHMQHNARDPLRDHNHGRIYRITYPSRPLVKPAKVDGASTTELLDNLKLSDSRTRYRSRRELRGRDADEVLAAAQNWVRSLNKSDKEYERHMLEALWVIWGVNKVDGKLTTALLKAKDHRVRAAAARVLRYNLDKISNAQELLELAAGDSHGRVRLEAINTASWMDKDSGLAVLEVAGKKPLDKDIKQAYDHAKADLSGAAAPKQAADPEELAWKKKGLKKKQIAWLKKGREVYHREAHCETCHQEDGKGLPDAGFPPLAGTKWVNDNDERLIKLTLHGIMGEIDVQGKTYNGAMTPFAGLLKDDEMAAVLTYIRMSFGNSGKPITTKQVKAVREATKDQVGLYQASELLKEHPHKN
jgi:mono/diheme cytochrome c family protein/glucose/arabinose dehydrogenase